MSKKWLWLIIGVVVVCAGGWVTIAVLTGEDEATYENAMHLFGRAEHERVIDLCTQIIAAYPESAEAYVLRGSGYFWTNELDWADADFAKAIECNPDYAPAYIARARLYDLRDFEHRLAAFKQKRATKDYTEDEGAQLRDQLLTIGDRAIEDYDQAIALCTRALKKDPYDANAYFTRGKAHYHKREYEAAVTDLTRALEITPDDEWAYVVRGEAYAWQKDYGRAIQDHTLAIEIEPKFAVAYVGRGSAYLHRMEPGKALQDYERALEINPEFQAAEGARTLALYAMAAWSEQDSSAAD